ncbi:MAG: hypothetical protein MZW92_10825 [Comamonadaceae bacterium]|nr:hypothetical protein [Comamonadaceae bacterium]
MILITAHDAPGLSEEAGRRGAAAFLAKPFSGTALLDGHPGSHRAGDPIVRPQPACPECLRFQSDVEADSAVVAASAGGEMGGTVIGTKKD